MVEPFKVILCYQNMMVEKQHTFPVNQISCRSLYYIPEQLAIALESLQVDHFASQPKKQKIYQVTINTIDFILAKLDIQRYGVCTTLI